MQKVIFLKPERCSGLNRNGHMAQITDIKALKIKIVSTGLFLPPKIQTSAELAPLIGRSEKWILSRTGIAERRIAEEPMDVIAAKAARDALGEGTQPDCIINASTTPVQLIPDSSVFIQKELGMSSIPSWSIHATCLSFLVALVNASALIQTGIYRKVLVVTAETGTPWRNLKEPESAALFGDGAAAAVIETTPQGEPGCLIDWEMNSWPEGAELTEFRGAGIRHPPDNPEKTKPEDNLFHMSGSAVYRMARERVAITLSTILKRNQLKPKDIDWVIPHQASGRAVEAASEYGFNKSQVVNIISEYGNCIAASIPMALAILNNKGLLKRGDLLLLGGTGAGLSVAFALIRW
jgi:3-oxoacyl-[acyl-carrier-protein] synthase-3